MKSMSTSVTRNASGVREALSLDLSFVHADVPACVVTATTSTAQGGTGTHKPVDRNSGLGHRKSRCLRSREFLYSHPTKIMWTFVDASARRDTYPLTGHIHPHSIISVLLYQLGASACPVGLPGSETCPWDSGHLARAPMQI